LQAVQGLQVIDNQYITLLVEVGVLGLGVFLAMFWVAFSFVWRSVYSTSTSPETNLVWGTGVALLGTLMIIFFFDGLSWPPTIILIWAMLGFLARYEQESATPGITRRTEARNTKVSNRERSILLPKP
jgi:O-antigen ligase